MASYGGLEGILTGLTKSTDHPSRGSLSRGFGAPFGPIKGRLRGPWHL